MKYLLTLSLALFVMTGIMAQDKTAAEYKNEGNAALKSKDFKTALANYEKAIELWGDSEELDAPTVYNAATSARKLKDYDKAIEYYKKSKELNYRPDISTYYIAFSLKNQGKEKEMEQVLLSALKEFPNSKYIGHMKKMLVTYYLKEGSVPFNEAAKIWESYNSLSEAQRTKELYDKTAVKANAKYEEAKPYFEKVLEIDPTNANAKKALTEINNNLKGKKA
ncbi:MAG: tetratricopeptide repeat protein [Chlorobi bacterium]|nr:tetratricopeptide repeat protein [Chlorobiota bacterium]